MEFVIRTDLKMFWRLNQIDVQGTTSGNVTYITRFIRLFWLQQSYI